MLIRKLYLFAALATLLAWAIPLSASAVSLLPEATGSLKGPANDVTIKIRNATDPDDDLDIVQIELDGTTADAYDITWVSAGVPDNPNGAETLFFGEGTPFVTMVIEDDGLVSRGFGGGEKLVLEGVEAEGDRSVVPIEDFIGVTVLITFQDRSDSDSDNWFDLEPLRMIFSEDPLGNPDKLVLTVVPEPGTAAMLGIGLVGLATATRRRS